MNTVVVVVSSARTRLRLSWRSSGTRNIRFLRIFNIWEYEVSNQISGFSVITKRDLFGDSGESCAILCMQHMILTCR